ncbi:MAG: LacI family DNA-binding transcriptional regulator [Bacteroidales bacterium]
MKKTKLQDIANNIGVSKTLVSMVMNGHGDKNGIKKETQEKVIALCKELNYKPNQMARSLRLGKTNTIGLIVADISNIFYAKMARSIEDYCNKYGYNLIICSSDEKDAKESSIIRMLKEKQVDGLIISSTLVDNSEILALKNEHFPFVLVDRYFPEIPDTNYVVIDNYQGAFNAVKHLTDLGHRNIAMLSILPFHITSVRDRNRGYLDALENAGIKIDHYLLCQIPFENIEFGVEMEIKKILSYQRKVTAILAVNQNIAIEAIKIMAKLNIKIPDDISLISFDDLPFYEIMNPSITAVDQPLATICKNAVEILMTEINNKDKTMKKKQLVLPTELIIRKSCKNLLINI